MSVSLGGSADAMDVAPTLAAARKSADIKPYWNRQRPSTRYTTLRPPQPFAPYLLRD